jgi:hypothetical protein
MEQYKQLMAAAKILATARVAVGKEDGWTISPAWSLLNSAHAYITKQANEALRGPDCDSDYAFDAERRIDSVGVLRASS